jgi:tetratricopeptide (TPR) repeat protein
VEEPARPAAKRPAKTKRLVILFLSLLAVFPAHAAGEDKSAFEVLDDKAPESSQGGFFHGNPLSAILFLPGPIAFAVILLFRRVKGGPAALVSLAFLFLGAASGGDKASFAPGVKDFKAGLYRQALASFQKADEALPGNAALKYDMALCYYKLGKPGYAIHMLQTGIKLNPSLSALNRLLDRIEEEKSLKNQVFPRDPVNPDLPFILLIALFNLTMVMLGLAVRFRRGSFAILLIFLIVLTAGSLAAFLYSSALLDQKYGVVASEKAVLKKIPLDKAEVWIDLQEGMSCYIKGAARGYVLVATERGLNGWIREQDLLVD